MWDNDAVTLTIKAIGEVESNLNYDAINYNDPITVGVAQWFGTRAAALLSAMASADPSGWSGVAASIRNDVDNRDSGSRWWTSRYLTIAEGNSLRPFLLANKDIQNTVFADDIADYVAVLEGIGFDIDGSTQAAIFFNTMYHQSPQAALQVVNTVGLSPSLDRIYRAALNHSVLGRYRNRQTEVRDIILAGDTTGVEDPGDPGDAGQDDHGGEGGGGGRLRSAISHISIQGDNLHIHRNDGGGVVVAYPTVAGRWIMTTDQNIGAPDESEERDPDPGSGEGVPGGTETQNALVEWMTSREGAFGYTRGPARNDPDRTGMGDCSSVVRQAYLDVMGIDIGSYTGEQYTTGTTIASGGSGDFPDPALLQPGDLLFTLTGWSGRSTVDHVEMVVDGDTTIGHSGNPPMGPTFWGIRQQLGWSTNWNVQRIVRT